MSNEASVQSGLTIRKGNLDYQSRPTTFRADVSAVGGPTPGMLLVTTAGVNVDLSQLSSPGLYRIQNLDPTNYIEYGPFDATAAVHEFIPLNEALPGESYVGRLSRFLGSEFGTASGTAATGSGTVLRIKAVGGTCAVLLEAFER